MASLDLDDMPPRIARLILGLMDGEALLVIQHGAVLRRLIAQTRPPGGSLRDAGPRMVVDTADGDPDVDAPPEPPPDPISSPVTEAKTREIFENFRAAIEDEF
jgi:hypothetical protein